MRRFPKDTRGAFSVFKKVDSPQKIQDFLDKMPVNFERNGETCRSALSALKRNESHCMEGALIAAAALWYHGHRPLILDLHTIDPDVDHVVALFKKNGKWGAISKTNHAVLKYRDPIYKSARELVMSYFNEYFLDNGVKTLRSYSVFPLSTSDIEWLVSPRHLWELRERLDRSKHHAVIDKKMEKELRLADRLEIQAGKLVNENRKTNR